MEGHEAGCDYHAVWVDSAGEARCVVCDGRLRVATQEDRDAWQETMREQDEYNETRWGSDD